MDNQILIYLTFLLIVGAYSKNVRIIGGEEANIEEFPFLVQIKLVGETKLICSGSIISRRHILTAAHCVYKKDRYYDLLRVYTGLSNLTETPLSTYRIIKYNIHPGFEGKLVGSGPEHCDVAVLKVHENIVFSIKQNKINLPTEDVFEGTEVSLSGWGYITYPGGQFSHRLRKVKVGIMKFAECARIFPYPVRQDQICTFTDNKSAGKGDSGGPVVFNGKLIGIISFSITWIPNLPQIQLNIFRHLDFIRSSLR